MKIKVEGIPIWVSFYMIFAAVFGIYLGVMAMGGEGVLGPTNNVGWGGRELGLAIAALIALLTKNSAVYLAVFLGGLPREASDFMEEFAKANSDPVGLAVIGSFLSIGLICAILSYRAYCSSKL